MNHHPDQTRFETMIADCGAQLQRTAVLLTGNWHQAEDLLQEVWTKAYTKQIATRMDHPMPYLRRMIINQFLSWKRRRSSSEVSLEFVFDVPNRPHDDLAFATRTVIFEGLATLPAKDRAVLILRYWEDLSVAETAQVLGTTSNAVRTRSSRAAARLRQHLSDHHLIAVRDTKGPTCPTTTTAARSLTTSQGR